MKLYTVLNIYHRLVIRLVPPHISSLGLGLAILVRALSKFSSILDQILYFVVVIVVDFFLPTELSQELQLAN